MIQLAMSAPQLSHDDLVACGPQSAQDPINQQQHPDRLPAEATAEPVNLGVIPHLEAADIVVDSKHEVPALAAERILEKLKERGYLADRFPRRVVRQ